MCLAAEAMLLPVHVLGLEKEERLLHDGVFDDGDSRLEVEDGEAPTLLIG